MNLYIGDCREVLKTLPDNSVDSVVTDPPYELGFMGKSWDSTGIAYDVSMWREVLRVLKPGGHLVSFGGTRTYHRMACAIEDAGFEIRDQIQWLTGQGFPKSLDVSKAIDKAAGAERRVVGVIEKLDSGFHRVSGSGKEQPEFYRKHDVPMTEPATESARKWDGWGTALKPANEPAVLARKPLSEKTVAANVLKWGTGALNIDASRIATNDRLVAGGNLRKNSGDERSGKSLGMFQDGTKNTFKQNEQGRFPANIILDEEAGKILDGQSGDRKAGGNLSGSEPSRTGGPGTVAYGKFNDRRKWEGYKDSGGASRFFYCAKASNKERWYYLTCDCETVNIREWENEGQSQNGGMDAISPSQDILEETSVEGSGSNIASFGNEDLVLFPPESKSTTETGLRQTIESKTLNPSHPQSIRESTQDATKEDDTGLSPAQSVKPKSQLPESTGTYQKRDGLSTGVVVPATLAKSFTKSACGICGTIPRQFGHPTQKPLALMRYLITLVTPPGGTVLDPFLGSGTTALAAQELGFGWIGIEKDSGHAEIIRARLDKKSEGQGDFFSTKAAEGEGVKE